MQSEVLLQNSRELPIVYLMLMVSQLKQMRKRQFITVRLL